MNSYKEELEYRVELLETLSGQMEAVQLAEELIDYGKLESSGVLFDPEARLEVIRYLASDIERDNWRLQRFRLAYVVRIVSLPGPERSRVAPAVQELCAKQLPFLRKSLGFKLSEIQAIVDKLEKNKKNRD